MITVHVSNVSFNRGIHVRDDSDVIIVVEGHSGFGEKGNDIVCSAVSVLVHTLNVSIGTHCGVKHKYCEGDGFFEAIIFAKNEKEEYIAALRHTLSFFFTGILETARAYPGTIDVTVIPRAEKE